MSAAACAGSASCAARKLARLPWLIAGLLLAAIGIESPSPAWSADGTRPSFLALEQGRIALLRGQYRSAVRLLTEALFFTDVPLDVRALSLGHRGVARAHLGEHRAAIHDFNAAIELSPEDPTLYNNRGNLLVSIGLHTEAVKDFDQAISLSPSYGAAYNNRGNALFLLADFAEAIADFSTAIDLMPLNAVPFNGRGKAALALGRPAGAMRDFSRALELNGRYAPAYIHRAEALTAIHRFQEAIGDYSAAMALGAGTAQLHRARASLYATLQMQGPALADLAEARKLDPAQDADADTLKAAEAAIAVPPTFPTAAPLVNESSCAEKPTAARGGDRVTKLADVVGPPAPIKVLYQSAAAQSDGGDDAASLAYRTALHCASQNAVAQEPLAQLASAEQDDAHALAAQAWRFLRRETGVYIAAHPQHPDISLRLEMHGSGEPELLHWQELGDPLKGIGLLHYRAGVSSAGERLEYVAVIDTRRARLLAIEPASWGERRADWSWSETELLVTDPQGVPSRVRLDGQISNKFDGDSEQATATRRTHLQKHGRGAKRPSPFASARAKASHRARPYPPHDMAEFYAGQRIPPRARRRGGAYPYAYQPYR